jgi:hypothetical protein
MGRGKRAIDAIYGGRDVQELGGLQRPMLRGQNLLDVTRQRWAARRHRAEKPVVGVAPSRLRAE